MPTNFELSVRTASESWRALRARRATPPVPPGSPQRIQTFRAALEQAEQQFRAAASIGYDSRALNLFYGLSQAGRALAACSPVLSNSDWKLTGHGLQLIDPERTGSDLPSVAAKVQDSRSAAFGRLSSVVGSDRPDVINVTDAWRCIWEAAHIAPIESSYYVPLSTYVNGGHLPGGVAGPIQGYQTATPEIPQALRDLPVEERPKLAEYLQRYPAFRGWMTEWPVGHPVEWPEGHVSLSLTWPVDGHQVGRHVLTEQLVRYRRHWMAIPTQPGRSQALHPLLAWWSVLYILSMLTRYHPDLWTGMIDVNKGQFATQLEYLLDSAMSAVPDLVDEAIGDVSLSGWNSAAD